MTLLDALRGVTQAGVRLDVPVRLSRVSCSPGSGYVADLEVLDAAMEPTEEVLERMPLPRAWLSPGCGVWAPPDDGVVVVATFAFSSAGWPVLIGLGELTRDDPPQESVPRGEYCIQARSARVWVRRAEVVLQDAGDDGARVRVADDRVEIASSIRSLLSVIEEIVDEIVAMQTVGAPNQHSVAPASQQALAAKKARLAEVLA